MDSPRQRTSVSYLVTVAGGGGALGLGFHRIEVGMTVAGLSGVGDLRLEVPTWVPGAYEFAPYGRDLFDFVAADEESGARLDVRREGWQGLSIETGAGPVVIGYSADCSSAELSEACGILDDHWGVLLGTRYLRVPEHSGPCRVTYDIPSSWEIHHPSGALRVGESTWEYPSYEVLLDTPVVFGKALQKFTRTVRGTEFHHVFLGDAEGMDSQVNAFLDDLEGVALALHDQFGSFPFDDYSYVFSFNPQLAWGLEHLTSTMISLGPEVFTVPSKNAQAVRVCAHELFHAWNVRRLRPAPLGDLDLYNGSFSDGLWFAEGFTRYYEFLICTRTGKYSAERFFSSIVNYYRHLVVSPAYERVSAVDSSLAAFLNHPKYPGRVNNGIDYYDHGMLIAFDVDARLRREAPGHSLDEVFRSFYEKYAGAGEGYTTEDVVAFFDQIDPAAGEQLELEATRAGELSVIEQLERLGFRVAEERIPYLGLLFRQGKERSVYGVLDGSPAARTGIAIEDEVTAINGRSFSPEALNWACRNESSVILEVRRGNELREYAIEVGLRTQIAELTWVGDDDQAALIASWLGCDFAPFYTEAFSLDFYENPHGIETVV